MKFRIFKKEKITPFEKTKSNKGFALLFSVLLSSLLLTIGLSIFSISLKELAISTASRQSVYAFYAADSGRECAKYWDTKMGNIPTLVQGQAGGDIVCGNQVIPLYNVSYNPVIDSEITTYLPGGSVEGVNPAVVFINDESIVTRNSPNFNVVVTKVLDNGNIRTSIQSYGHDSTSGDRVERAIRQDY